MTLTGRIVGGQVVLDAPAPLPDGTPVRVHAETPATPPPPPDTPDRPLTFLERYKDVIGAADDPSLPTDGALNHDHYLYGAPKKP